MKYNTILTQVSEMEKAEIKKTLAEANGFEKMHKFKGFNPNEWGTIQVYQIWNGFTMNNLKNMIDFDNNKIAFIVKVDFREGTYYYNDFDCCHNNFRDFSKWSYYDLDFFRKNKTKSDIFNYTIYILVQSNQYCNFRNPYQPDSVNDRFYCRYGSTYSKIGNEYMGSLKIDKSGYLLPVDKMQRLKWEAYRIRHNKDKNAFLNYSNFDKDIKEVEEIRKGIINKFIELKNNIDNLESFNKFIKFYNFFDYKTTENGIDYNTFRQRGFREIIAYIDNFILKIKNKKYNSLDDYLKTLNNIKKWNFIEIYQEFKKRDSLEKLKNYVEDEKGALYQFYGDLIKEKTIIINADNIIYVYNGVNYVIDLKTQVINEVVEK